MSDDSAEKPDECDCCQFETSDLTDYGYARDGRDGRAMSPEDMGHKWLCDLCAGTMAGNAYEHPRSFEPGTFVVLKTICYVGNAILRAIRESK